MSVGDALDIRTEGDVVVARLMGEIDLANARPIGSLVGGAVTNDAMGVVLDLSDVTYLDSSGVHLIFELAERLSDRQQQLALVVPAEARIRRVLDLVKADAVVAIFLTVDEALDTVRTIRRPSE
jgi:anti-sigma B factor antagonist